jgi:hypothetical protein
MMAATNTTSPCIRLSVAPGIERLGTRYSGEPLAETVEVHPIPKYDACSDAVVNRQRVIVDRKDRWVLLSWMTCP